MEWKKAVKMEMKKIILQLKSDSNNFLAFLLPANTMKLYGWKEVASWRVTLVILWMKS